MKRRSNLVSQKNQVEAHLILRTASFTTYEHVRISSVYLLCILRFLYVFETSGATIKWGCLYAGGLKPILSWRHGSVPNSEFRETTSIFVLLRLNNRGIASKTAVCSSKEAVFNTVVVHETSKEKWDLDKTRTTPDTNGSGLWKTFRDLWNESRTMHNLAPPGLVDVVQMAKRWIKLEE